MKCPTCLRKTDSIKSVVYKGGILTGCSSCVSSNIQKGTDTSHRYYKREQQTKFRRELTQPVEPREFIRAYGIDKARERGYSDAMIRKYSN